MPSILTISNKDRVRRLGDSKNTIDALTKAARCKSLCLALVFLGKNPSNRKRSVGNPEALRAAKSADAPGTGITVKFSSMVALTNRYPGSETRGVPASETSATISPDFKRSMISEVALSALCSWYEIKGALNRSSVFNFLVTLVSSHAIASAACNTAIARSVISLKLPIGVETIWSPGSIEVSKTLFVRISPIDLSDGLTDELSVPLSASAMWYKGAL